LRCARPDTRSGCRWTALAATMLGEGAFPGNQRGSWIHHVAPCSTMFAVLHDGLCRLCLFVCVAALSTFTCTCKCCLVRPNVSSCDHDGAGPPKLDPHRQTPISSPCSVDGAAIGKLPACTLHGCALVVLGESSSSIAVNVSAMFDLFPGRWVL